jgi:hypothetical protein
MIATRVALKATLRAVSAVALTAIALFTSGCSVFSTPIGSDTMPVAGVAIHGAVHGGQQPINGASIGLYAAGSGGYGSSTGVTNLLGTPVNTDVNGAFNITLDYTCPSGTSLMYLTASGGDAGSGSNSAIMLVAPLGACSTLNSGTFININEVTTAATAIALGQFIAPAADSIATSAANSVGLTNAFATVNNLVSISTGNAVTSATLPNGCTSSSALCITTAPESAKLYTIANILAACVNSTGPGSAACTALFPAVTPSSATAPTDTLQAAVYMSQNPTSNNASTSATNLTNLFALQTGTSPFVGVSTQPTDWTVGIRYTDTKTGTPLLLKPQNVAVDGTGNVWVLSNSSALPGFGELSPTGTPLLSTPTSMSLLIGITNTPFNFSVSGINPRNLAIDTANNVWFTTSSSITDGQTPGVHSNGTIWEYATNGSSTGYNTSKSAYGLAIDASNNIFVSQQSSSAVYELFEFPGGDLTKPVGYPIATAVAGTAGTSGSNGYIAPENLAFDPTGNLWMTGGVSGSNFTVALTNIQTAATLNGASYCNGSYAPCVLTSSLSNNTYTTYSLSGSGITFANGLSAGTNSMFIADTGTYISGVYTAGTGNRVSDLPYASPVSTQVTAGDPTGTGFTQPKFAATDGAGNVWVANVNTTPTGGGATAGGSISEISGAGVILSPLTSSLTTLNPGYVHAGLSNAAGIATDPSGNVWVADSSNSVFEVVGAAAPTDTPIAKSLADGKVGVKP